MDRSTLGDFYTKRDYKVQSVNANVELDLQEWYVNLVLLEKLENEQELGEPINFYHDGFSHRDKIPGRRKKYGHIVDPKNIINGGRNRVIIYGSPGTGKTTLCKKLVYDFYKKGMWADYFQDIVWIKLAALKNPNNKKVRQLLNTFAKGAKVLYVLDGWDEIQDLVLDEDNVDEDIEMIKSMAEEKEEYPFVILTSRPYAKLRFANFDCALELTGFNWTNVKRYITNVLEKENRLELKGTIVGYINSNSVFSDMVSIPILLDIFLYVWEEIEKFSELELTMTKLYELLVCKLWDKFLKKKIDSIYLKDYINDIVKEECICLCKLAKEWLTKGTTIFHRGVFPEIRKVKETWFLSGVTADNSDNGFQDYEFIHLTVLEFFAALEVINWNEEEFKEFVTGQKFNPEFTVVFQFIAGLLASDLHNLPKWSTETRFTQQEKLGLFFDYLEGYPNDLVGINCFMTIVQCIQECSNIFDKQRQNSIFKEIAGAPHQLNKLSSLPQQLVEILVHEDLKCLVEYKYHLPQISDECISKMCLDIEDDWESIFHVLCKQRKYSQLTVEMVGRILDDTNHILSGKPIFGCKLKSRVFFHFFKYLIRVCQSTNANLFGYVIGAHDERVSDSDFCGLDEYRVSCSDAKLICQILLNHGEVRANILCGQIYDSSDTPVIILQKLIKCGFVPLIFLGFLKNVKEFSSEIENALMGVLLDSERPLHIQRSVNCILLFQIESASLFNKLKDLLHLCYDLNVVGVVNTILSLQENPKDITEQIEILNNFRRYIGVANDHDNQKGFCSTEHHLESLGIGIPPAEHWLKRTQAKIDANSPEAKESSLFLDPNPNRKKRTALMASLRKKCVTMLEDPSQQINELRLTMFLQRDPDFITTVIKSITCANWEVLLQILLKTQHYQRNAIYVKENQIFYGSGLRFPCHSKSLQQKDIKSIYQFLDKRVSNVRVCRWVRLKAMGTNEEIPQFQKLKMITVSQLENYREREYLIKAFTEGLCRGEKRGANEELLKFAEMHPELRILVDLDDLEQRWIYRYPSLKRKVDLFFSSPFYLNFTNSLVTDEDILVIAKFVNEFTVFSLILSDNRITQTGFTDLMRVVCTRRVKHLLLDRNFIYLENHVSDYAFGKYLKLCNSLEVIDLSFNYISSEILQSLKVSSECHSDEPRSKVNEKGEIVSNFLIMNDQKTKIVYSRRLINPIVASVDILCPVDFDVKLIDVSVGCIAYAEKVSNSIIRNMYSGHAILILERIISGQRELWTAELKCRDKRCVIEFKNVAPLESLSQESLQNRLRSYKLHRGLFPNEVVENVISSISHTKDIADFYKYEVFEGAKEEDENRMNCIQWANDIMKPYLGFQIEKVKLPLGYGYFNG